MNFYIVWHALKATVTTYDELKTSHVYGYYRFEKCTLQLYNLQIQTKSIERTVDNFMNPLSDTELQSRFLNSYISNRDPRTKLLAEQYRRSNEKHSLLDSRMPYGNLSGNGSASPRGLLKRVHPSVSFNEWQIQYEFPRNGSDIQKVMAEEAIAVSVAANAFSFGYTNSSELRLSYRTSWAIQLEYTAF